MFKKLIKAKLHCQKFCSQVLVNRQFACLLKIAYSLALKDCMHQECLRLPLNQSSGSRFLGIFVITIFKMSHTKVVSSSSCNFSSKSFA